jgi:uncharacterized membrane protein AbrB (regulator of aidB expression)
MADKKDRSATELSRVRPIVWFVMVLVALRAFTADEFGVLYGVMLGIAIGAVVLLEGADLWRRARKPRRP